MDGQNLVTAIVVNLKHYSMCVSGEQCREEGRRATMHVVNILCMRIHIIHYLHYRFSVTCKSNAHTYILYLLFMLLAIERFPVTKYYFNLLIRVLFPIIGIVPATVASRATPETPTTAVNTATLTNPTTAVNIATPTVPQPSSTGNIIVQFDGLCLCIVSDRRTNNDMYVR